MAITLVEVAEVPGDLNKLTKDLSEAVTQTAAPAEPAKKAEQPPQHTQQPAPFDGVELPEKLKGKSPAEIADMYRNLESAYGRMANDLGTQRKLTDRLLDLKRADDLNRNQPEPVKVDRAKLLEDPTAELDRFIAAREASRETETAQRLTNMEQGLAQKDFMTKHPDAHDVGKDPAFVQWISASPFRQRMAAQAYNGDWGVADELMSDFKAARPASPSVEQQQQQNTQEKQQAASQQGLEGARNASLESTTTGTDSTGKAGKVYRRVDLMELRLKNPETYHDPAFQDEILRAYAQGRVK